MRMVGFVVSNGRPAADQLTLGQKGVAEKTLGIDAFGRVVRAGVDTTWGGQLGA